MPETRGLLSLWTADPRAIETRDVDVLGQFLDREELDRLSRFRFAEDAKAFVLAHALQRVALGRRIGTSASGLRFSADGFGKPRVEHQPKAPHFSLSRSRECIAVAICDQTQVGVDVEPVDASRADADLLAPFFAMSEIQSDRDFHEHWAALEAFWKCMGTGLSHDHPRLVPKRNGHAIELRFEAGEPSALAGRAVLLDAVPGCALAVATSGATTHRIRHTHAGDALSIHRFFRAQLAEESLCPC